MGGRWNLFGFHVHKVVWVVLILHLYSKESLGLNLEGMALLKFRSKVELDPYGALANWDPDEGDPCSWTGVHCNDGKVEILNLKEQSLGGLLAPELGELSNLKALILSNNNFSGVIPKDIGRLTMLELLDLRANNLDGIIPMEIGELRSIKFLLLSENKFLEGLHMLSEIKVDQNHSSNSMTQISCINRKVMHCVWQTGLQRLKRANLFMTPLTNKLRKFNQMLPLFRYHRSSSQGRMSSQGQIERLWDNQPNSIDLYTLQNGNGKEKFMRRRLLQETRNLPAAPVSSASVIEAGTVPSSGSGCFPAMLNGDGLQFANLKVPEDLVPNRLPAHPEPSTPNDQVRKEHTITKRLSHWSYILGAILLSAISIGILLKYRRGAATIGPWKTGLSGELQKALITGAATLNRVELESACEDFSNIIATFPEYTVFKGTLSSGVEIAVASTVIKSLKDWSKRSQTHFRRKIDTLSRINHKNFVNLLGYCEENEPFMRMMVLEYAANGTVHDHLHLKDYEHLDWSSRVRIIMGTAYCLQYMHHEVKPSVSHPDLQASCVLLTDDYAAKVVDCSVWKEVIRKKGSGDYDNDLSGSTFVDIESNVYSFGILLLEIISGKLPYTDQHDCLLNWAEQYLSDRTKMKCLVDPTLKSFKDDELEIICEVIHDCTLDEPKKRSSMKAIISKLRNVIPISPEAASPRLSPLWWAELEILSVEAS